MKVTEFFDKVDACPDLTGLHIDENRQEVTVAYQHSHGVTVLSVDAILQNDWPTIKDILTHKREPHCLQHFTRVVGYYSRVDNWNPSKVSELHDRHKGDYSV